MNRSISVLAIVYGFHVALPRTLIVATHNNTSCIRTKLFEGHIITVLLIWEFTSFYNHFHGVPKARLTADSWADDGSLLRQCSGYARATNIEMSIRIFQECAKTVKMTLCWLSGNKLKEPLECRGRGMDTQVKWGHTWLRQQMKGSSTRRRPGFGCCINNTLEEFRKSPVISMTRTLEVSQQSTKFFPRKASYREGQSWQSLWGHVSKKNKYRFERSGLPNFTLEPGRH